MGSHKLRFNLKVNKINIHTNRILNLNDLKNKKYIPNKIAMYG
jgi:hypothetical protein